MTPDDGKPPGDDPAFDADPVLRAFKIKPSITPEEANFPGAEILAIGPPKVVHERLIEDDPLGVSALVLQRIEDQAILWDPVRILRASMARIAHDAWRYRGKPDLTTWLNSCIDKAVHMLLETAENNQHNGIPARRGEIPNADSFVKILGIERPMVRRAVLEFQTLPLPIRRTFHAILIRGVTMESWCSQGHATMDEVEEYILYAVEMMTSFGHTDMPCPIEPYEEGYDD